MAEFSVQIISRGEPTLPIVLDSVRSQRHSDYELVVVDASASASSAPAPRYPASLEIVPVSPETKALEARCIAAEHSDARYSLLLDSTRPLKPDCLATLSLMTESFDIIVAREDSIGSGYLADCARLDRQIVQSRANYDLALRRSVAYLLPRVFRSDILKEALAHIRASLNIESMRRISYGEHHMIAAESMRLSSRIGMTDHAVLSHFEDSDMRTIISKYRRYGSSQRYLNRLEGFEYASDPTLHFRSFSHVRPLDALHTIPLFLLRTAFFGVGYLFG